LRCGGTGYENARCLLRLHIPAATKELAGQAKPDARRQITLTIPADMLRRLDALAAEIGQTRTGVLLVGAAQLLRDGA